jgi:predicted nucleic acid-binding protein
LSRIWIVNASPLISLSRIEIIDLLPKLASQLIIPEPVADEVRIGRLADSARRWIGAEGQAHLKRGLLDPRVLAWDLGSGETAVISLALSSPGAEVIIDDLQARKCASGLGLRVRGSLGVLLLAKHEGLISAVAPLIGALRDDGFYLSEALYRDALREAGELEN